MTKYFNKEKFKTNKKKNITIISAILILMMGVIGYIIYPFYQETSKEIYKDTGAGDYKSIVEYETYICKFDLTSPLYVYISKNTISDKGIVYRYSYYKLQRDNIFSQDWTIDKYEGYQGGGNIYDDSYTFDKLQKEVKEDCNGFKERSDFQEPKTKEQQIAEEQRKEEAEVSQEKADEEFRKNNYGYIGSETSDYIADYLTEEEGDKLRSELRDLGLYSDPDRFNEAVKYMIENYGLPEKEGYPIN